MLPTVAPHETKPRLQLPANNSRYERNPENKTPITEITIITRREFCFVKLFMISPPLGIPIIV